MKTAGLDSKQRRDTQTKASTVRSGRLEFYFWPFPPLFPHVPSLIPSFFCFRFPSSMPMFLVSRNQLLYILCSVSYTQRFIQLVQLRFICTTFTAGFTILLCFAERPPPPELCNKKRKRRRSKRSKTMSIEVEKAWQIKIGHFDQESRCISCRLCTISARCVRWWSMC